MITTAELSPAARAFDAIADGFDQRFGAWLSVAAQRRAVRAELLRAFPVGSRVLEVGGGTGLDASWLEKQGRSVLLTDASPAMVRVASLRVKAAVAPAERLDELDEPAFDGAFSNFAALNCVADLGLVGRGLARLIKPGGQALLVIFGTCSPGEVVVQLVRGDLRAAVRRLHRVAPARLSGQHFEVYYHRKRDITRAMAPWFKLVERRGIGICVPPSAAEPWITTHRGLLVTLTAIDRLIAGPLAALGDHVLYRFERLDT